MHDRQLEIRFTTAGQFETPALVDYSDRELELLSLIADVISKFPAGSNTTR